MTDDTFLQEQINDLQQGQTELRGLVNRAAEKAARNHDAMLGLRDDVQRIQRSMICRDEMKELLIQDRNEQIVRGLKWGMAIIAAAIATKFAEAMDWFHQLGD
jgi:Mg2+/Co2+ transporter CorB